jgi:hypothetical protein
VRTDRRPWSEPRTRGTIRPVLQSMSRWTRGALRYSPALRTERVADAASLATGEPRSASNRQFGPRGRPRVCRQRSCRPQELFRRPLEMQAGLDRQRPDGMQGPAFDEFAEHEVAGPHRKARADEVADEIANAVVTRIFPAELEHLVDAPENGLAAAPGIVRPLWPRQDNGIVRRHFRTLAARIAAAGQSTSSKTRLLHRKKISENPNSGRKATERCRRALTCGDSSSSNARFNHGLDRPPVRGGVRFGVRPILIDPLWGTTRGASFEFSTPHCPTRCMACSRIRRHCPR